MKIRIPRLGALAVVWAALASAQLTPDQKIFDFEHLASMMAKYYAPYEWKRDVMGFDLYNVAPWLERVRKSRDDLEFYELMAEYVAALRDSHSMYTVPSDFVASIGLGVDLYDGRYLIESIDRTRLPEARYPFQIGDEVVSLDGKAPEEWVAAISKWGTMANPRGTRRVAASFLFSREQAYMPRAHEIGETARVVVRRESGATETYDLPWVKTGVPLTAAGPVPWPRKAVRHMAEAAPPHYLQPLLALQNKQVRMKGRVRGWGARTPVYALPESFTQRLGRASADFHYSGTYEADGKRIGFLRIPSFSPPNTSAAVRELTAEIAWMQQNTHGLVVDVTRNPGGGCYGETALSLVIPYPYRTIGDEIRPSQALIRSFEASLNQARAARAEQWTIDLLESLLGYLRTAYRENRGRTGAMPLCTLSLDVTPTPSAAYSKPLIVLIDELTVSYAEVFAAVIQDAARGPLVGMRTDGAGGAVGSGPAGYYSEGDASYSISLGTRKAPVATSDYPTTSYIENVGVRPDVTLDSMTRENLITRGQPYVDAFTAAILDEIRRRP